MVKMMKSTNKFLLLFIHFNLVAQFVGGMEEQQAKQNRAKNSLSSSNSGRSSTPASFALSNQTMAQHQLHLAQRQFHVAQQQHRHKKEEITNPGQSTAPATLVLLDQPMAQRQSFRNKQDLTTSSSNSNSGLSSTPASFALLDQAVAQRQLDLSQCQLHRAQQQHLHKKADITNPGQSTAPATLVLLDQPMAQHQFLRNKQDLTTSSSNSNSGLSSTPASFALLDQAVAQRQLDLSQCQLHRAQQQHLHKKADITNPGQSTAPATLVLLDQPMAQHQFLRNKQDLTTSSSNSNSGLSSTPASFALLDQAVAQRQLDLSQRQLKLAQCQLYLAQHQSLNNKQDLTISSSNSSSNSGLSSTPPATATQLVQMTAAERAQKQQTKFVGIPLRPTPKYYRPNQSKNESVNVPQQIDVNVSQLQALNLSPQIASNQQDHLSQGSSSKMPILIQENQFNEQMRKLKRPMEDEAIENVNVEANGRKQIKLKASTEEETSAQKQQQTEALKARRAFLDNVWQLIVASFGVLRTELMPLDELMLLAQQGKAMVLTSQQASQIVHQIMNPDQILDRIGTKLVPTELVQKGHFHSLNMGIIDEINAQASNIFGQQLFKIKHQNEFKFERIIVESESIQDKRLKVFYFFKRFLRKLGGQLETPFSQKGNFIQYKDCIDERTFIVQWIRQMMKRFDDVFKRFVEGSQKHGLQAMINLENKEAGVEIKQMVFFSAKQTLAPFYGEDYQISDINLEELMKLINKISSNNIACVMISSNKPLDLQQIVKESAQTKSDFGSSAVFVALFEYCFKKEQKGDGQYKLIQNANVYSQFYQNLVKLMNKLDDASLSIALGTEYKALKSFFEKSIEQLTELVNGWEKALLLLLLKTESAVTEHGFIINEVSEKGFISDYLLEHCMHLI